MNTVEHVCIIVFYCLFDLYYRIATSTRNGGPEELCLERYVEALSDKTSG